MTAGEAIRTALRVRPDWHVPESFQPSEAELKVIEVVEGAPVEGLPPPGLVRDLAAWIVRLVFEEAWVEFAIDDNTGKVVRLRRSR